MYSRFKRKNCHDYKPANEDVNFSYKRIEDSCDCKNCVFFSSQNCRMDAADSIQPDLDFL